VGDNDRLDTFFVVFEIGCVGDYVVDSKKVLRREFKPHIDNYDVVLVLEGHHVFTNLIQSSQWDHFYLSFEDLGWFFWSSLNRFFGWLFAPVLVLLVGFVATFSRFCFSFFIRKVSFLLG